MAPQWPSSWGNGGRGKANRSCGQGTDLSIIGQDCPVCVSGVVGLLPKPDKNVSRRGFLQLLFSQNKGNSLHCWKLRAWMLGLLLPDNLATNSCPSLHPLQPVAQCELLPVPHPTQQIHSLLYPEREKEESWPSYPQPVLFSSHGIF